MAMEKGFVCQLKALGSHTTRGDGCDLLRSGKYPHCKFCSWFVHKSKLEILKELDNLAIQISKANSNDVYIPRAKLRDMKFRYKKIQKRLSSVV